MLLQAGFRNPFFRTAGESEAEMVSLAQEPQAEGPERELVRGPALFGYWSPV